DVISSEIYSGLSQDSLMVGKKYYITSAGINANELKITNVADGEIAAGSKDAANAGQLYSEQLARIAGDTITTSGSYYVSGVSTISAISSLDAQVKLNENAILANSNSITSLQTTKADKATTLAGYGITNAYTKAEANDKFAQKATTLAGYGITDAYTTAAADAKFAQKAATLAGYGITDAYTTAAADAKFAQKATTLAGYGITDAYTTAAADAKFAQKATTLAGYGITNAYTKAEANDKFAQKATTLAGYGITDAYTTEAADAKFAQKAATLAGYGITDAYTKQEIDNALGKKADATQVAELAEKTAASERKITVLENTAQEHTEKINNLTTDMTQAKSDIAALETASAGKADRAYVDDRFDTIKAQTTAKDGFYVKRAKTVAENLEALDLAINSQEQPSAASAFDVEDVNATATGAGASALGKNAKAAGEKSVAIGYGAKASGANSIAIGTGHVVTGNNSGAFGDPNVISGNGSYAIGNNNTIEGDNNFVLGSSVKIGEGVKNTIAFGSVDGKTLEVTESNTVAVGGRTISGMADGKYATDAVTVGQVDRAFANVQNQLGSVSNEVKEVGAISAALAGLHYVEPSGEGDDKVVGAVAYGGYRGANAEAIGIAYKPNPNMMFSASTSISNGNDSQNAYNAGFSIKFGKGETAKTRAELQKQVKFVNEENKVLKTQIVSLSAENADIIAENKEQNEKLVAQDKVIRKLLERVEKLENNRAKPAPVSEQKQPAKTVQPKPETKTVAVQKPVSGKNIQVLSSARRSDSQRLADNLNAKGYNAFVGEGVVKDRTYYRTFVDGGDNPQAVLAQLKAAGINGFIFK
ncbi:MAG: SPOR domain-containing protein, partial [Synergistaceae bacterium]|nr:SPOR domain-containing protein [Candidatus Equadaptatus faecalis]